MRKRLAGLLAALIIGHGGGAWAEDLDLAVSAFGLFEPGTQIDRAFDEDDYDPNREIRIGTTAGLKLKGTGDKVRIDAFLEQGEWEMRGKFLSGRQPLDLRGAMIRIERPVDWFGWMED
jgi:hypothetical protein